MKILVTGGLGINGACVTRQLVESGVRPVVIDARPDFSLLPEGIEKQIQFEQGDLVDLNFVERVYAEHKIDRTIHLAALIVGGEQNPYKACEVNVLATLGLLDAAVRHSAKRFVFASSRAVYGPLDGDVSHPHYKPVPEDHRQRSGTVYDVCKIAGEGFGRYYTSKFGLEFVAMRFASTFGPGKTERYGGAYGPLCALIEGAYHNRPVRIEAGGDQIEDIIYIEDVARAMVVACLHSRPSFTEYNISSERGYTLKDIAEVVREFRPNADIQIGPGLNLYQMKGDYSGIIDPNYSGILDATRAREDLDFTPSFSLRDAIQHYYKRLEDLARQKENRVAAYNVASRP